MIRNHPEKPMKKLPSETTLLYSPVKGASYCHHASIAFFKGKFYALWSNGFEHEDECGQRVMLATSDDGVTWGKPVILVEPCEVGSPDLCLTAGGLYTNGEKLQAYFGCYGYKNAGEGDVHGRVGVMGKHFDTFLGHTSTVDGITWTKAERMDCTTVPNHPPMPTSSGRVIISGGFLYPYSDNPDGDGPFIDAGIDGGVFGSERPWDDSDSIQFVTKQNGWDCRLICEGSFFETDDKVLHMLLRSNSEWLWLTESRDDGVTWTPPVKTGFSDDNTKFHCGRLPDGRWYVVSCPITSKGARNPLVISLSKDGEDFDQAYIIRDEKYDQIFDGLYKGGLYGYPHTLIHGGVMYVIYSKHKEAIEITRIKISDIE